MKAVFPFALSCSAVSNVIGAVPRGKKDCLFTNAVTDSGEASPGSLFLCLLGEHADGHDYISHAAKNGAAGVICRFVPQDAPDMAYFVCPDVTEALKKLAFFVSCCIRHKTVAITGSYGKTTAKTFLSTVLETKYKVHCTKENHNNMLGVCMTMLDMRANTEYAVYELGMNHASEIDALSALCLPDVSVITAVGSAHIGLLGSLSAIEDAKLEICRHMKGGPLILPHDMAQSGRITYLPKMTFDEKNRDADFYISADKESDMEILYLINLPDKTAVPLKMKNMSQIALNAALRACAAAYACGMTAPEIAYGLSLCELPRLRQQKTLLSGICIILDNYNCCPESLDAAYVRLSGEKAKRRFVLLGDMLELGESSHEYHLCGGKGTARDAKADFLFAVGKHADDYAEGAMAEGMQKDNIFTFTDSEYIKCSDTLFSLLAPGDALLCKGSHRSSVGKVMRELQSKLQTEGTYDP